MKNINRVLLRVGLAVAVVLALGIGHASAFPFLDEPFYYPVGPLASSDPLHPSPWHVGEDDMAFSVVASILGKTNVFQLIDQISSTSAFTTKRDNFYPLDMGVMYFDFDIAYDGDPEARMKMTFRNHYSQPNAADALTLFGIWLHGDDLRGSMGNLHVDWWADSNHDIIVNMTPNQWYHITMAIDLDNERQVDFYVDDPTMSGAPVLEYEMYDLGYIPAEDKIFETVAFQTYKLDPWNQTDFAVYFDNFAGQMQCFMTVEPLQRDLVPLDLTAAPTPPHVTVFTLSNPGLDTVTSYTIEEVDSAGDPYDYSWLSLDKTSGGPLVTGSSDTVTATIDDSLSPAGPVAYLKFSNSCGYSEIRRLDVITDRILVWYMADVEPDAPDSHGVGQTFLLDQGAKQGQLAFDGAAIDCRAWHIVDSALEKTKWQSNDENSPMDISSAVGATMPRAPPARTWPFTSRPSRSAVIGAARMAC